MKRRWALLVPVGIVVAVFAVMAIGGMSRVPRVCPAIGYAYTGPVDLVFSIPRRQLQLVLAKGARLSRWHRMIGGSGWCPNPRLTSTSCQRHLDHREATAAIGGRTATCRGLPLQRIRHSAES